MHLTQPGKPLSQAYVRRVLRKLAERAAIEKRVHPHGLRHTHASELAREGVPMPVIQAQLGHASLQTTSVYLDHIQPQEVVETMQRRTWTTSVRDRCATTGVPRPPKRTVV